MFSQTLQTRKRYFVLFYFLGTNFSITTSGVTQNRKGAPDSPATPPERAQIA